MIGTFLKKLTRKTNEAKPNIIMILLDQFRNDARSVHPIFDQLGQRGVLFSNSITYAPYTLASLHATFTGLYGCYNGVDAYTKSDHYREKDCVSLTQYLKKCGYYTRGYTFSKILFPHNGFDKLSIIHEDDEKDILASHKEELEICYNQEKPFFSFLHYGEIHHEIVKRVIKKYDNFDAWYFNQIDRNRQQYLELAEAAGEYVSELIKTIDAKDPDANTMIVLLTDHGGGVGEKPGEKAYGIYTYDYTVCTWVYFVLPGVFPEGETITSQTRTIDILPTILDILKLRTSKKNRENLGASLLPLIQGKEEGHRGAFCETGGVEGPYPSPNKSNIKCYRDGKWKLIFNSTINQYELYDIESDPQEKENLYLNEQDKAEELLVKMAPYL